MADDYETYHLGDFTLKSGEVIPDAFIAYKTLGDPSLPVIIYPTWVRFPDKDFIQGITDFTTYTI